MPIQDDIDDANLSRIEREARRQKRAAQKAPVVQYMGTDSATGQARVISGSGAAPVRVANHSNTQARPGDIKRGFAGGFDRGNVRKSKNPIFPGKAGEVKVLAYRFNGTDWEIWLGGDRQDPLLVKAGIPVEPYCWLDVTGSGENDWIIGARWGFPNRTIAVFHGADRLLDWELQTTLQLTYRGHGFWSQEDPRGYSPNASTQFLTQQTINLPTQVLGDVVGSNCYDQVNGLFSTISLGYCENVAIVGNADVTNGFDNIRTGFQPVNYPYQFSGNNLFSQESRTRDYWEGTLQSAGYLGIPGEACVIGSAQRTGTEQRPRRRQDATFREVRNFASQWYQPFAYQGVINQNAGSQSIQHQRNSVNPGGSSGNIKRVDYVAKCVNFTSPVSTRWSVGTTNFETWTLAGIPSGTASETGITVADAVQTWLTPTISKTTQVNASTPAVTQTATGIRDFYYAIASLPTGCLFQRSYYSGSVNLDMFFGVTGFNGSFQDSYWLNWNNAETEVDSTSELLSIWNGATIQDAGQQYPIYWQVDFQVLEDEIFEGDINAPVSKFEPSLVAGKLTWTEVEPPEEKVALSMADIGDNSTFVAAKYWN